MTALMPGIVSNCWTWQLHQEVPLPALIEEAQRLSLHVIELRHGAVGRFQVGDQFQATALTELPLRFPQILWNIAIGCPYLNPAFTATDARFVEAIEAAEAVAGRFAPHLRLTDPQTEQLDGDPGAVAQRLVGLARPILERDGILTLENNVQAWTCWSEAFLRARAELGQDGSRLRLCFDPANLLLREDSPDPAEACLALNGDWLSMIHLKQLDDRSQQSTTIGPGALDWSALARSLQAIGYQGPALLELAPSEDVWDQIHAARVFLSQAGLQFDPAVEPEPIDPAILQQLSSFDLDPES